MAQGAFIVSRDTHDPRDIRFEVNGAYAGDIPEEQLDLRDEVDRALLVLRHLFPEGDARFEMPFRSLLSLSQLGLVGPAAQPTLAGRALAALKAEVTVREAGRVKNQYMKRLGLRAVLLGAPALLLGGVLLLWADLDPALSHFLFLWAGCMAGVWLSFGARKMRLAFEELHVLEEDRLEPMVRLVFAGVLTLFLGLLFATGMVAVVVGEVSTAAVNTDVRVSLLIGLACGLSEQVLSTKVTQQATRLLDAG